FRSMVGCPLPLPPLAPPLFTLTVSVVVAVWPFMLTEAVSVLLPSPTLVVSHVNHSVVPDSVWFVRTVPSTESVKVLDSPHAAVADGRADGDPPTAAPEPGWLTDTRTRAGAGAPPPPPFDTLTIREVVALPLPESVAVTVSVCEPLPTVVVF